MKKMQEKGLINLDMVFPFRKQEKLEANSPEKENRNW